MEGEGSGPFCCNESFSALQKTQRGKRVWGCEGGRGGCHGGDPPGQRITQSRAGTQTKAHGRAIQAGPVLSQPFDLHALPQVFHSNAALNSSHLQQQTAFERRSFTIHLNFFFVGYFAILPPRVSLQSHDGFSR